MPEVTVKVKMIFKRPPGTPNIKKSEIGDYLLKMERDFNESGGNRVHFTLLSFKKTN